MPYMSSANSGMPVVLKLHLEKLLYGASDEHGGFSFMAIPTVGNLHITTMIKCMRCMGEGRIDAQSYVDADLDRLLSFFTEFGKNHKHAHAPMTELDVTKLPELLKPKKEGRKFR